MMDSTNAKQILASSLAKYGDKLDASGLWSPSWYLAVDAEDEEATLDGTFTADELESIAAWMRDPKAVSDA